HRVSGYSLCTLCLSSRSACVPEPCASKCLLSEGTEPRWRISESRFDRLQERLHTGRVLQDCVATFDQGQFGVLGKQADNAGPSFHLGADAAGFLSDDRHRNMLAVENDPATGTSLASSV